MKKFLLIFLLACSGLGATPTRDNYTTYVVNPAATSASFSHSCAGVSRMMVLQIIMNGTSANVNVNSASYAGSALTFLRRDRANSRTVELWYGIAPATGNNTVSISMQASVITQIVCMSFNEASQTANPGVSNFASFTSATSASVSYTSTANESAIIDSIYWNSTSAALTPEPETTEIVQISNTWRQQARYEGHDTPTSHQHDISFDTAQSGGYGVLEIIDDDNLTHTFTKTITESFTVSPTFTYSPTATPTPTISETFTYSPTKSPSPSITETSTPLPSPTFTKTKTFTVSPTPVDTNTVTATPTITRTITQTSTITETFTISPTFTISNTFTLSPTVTPIFTITKTITRTFTATPTRTPLDQWTPVPTPGPDIWSRLEEFFRNLND